MKKWRSNMATEYEVVQRQRMEYVTLMHQWGLGLISIAAAILSAFLMLANGKYWHIGSVLVFSILCTWRLFAHYFDERIKELYYDIIRLEEKLDFNFYRGYLKRRAFDNLGYYKGKMSKFIDKYYHNKSKINIFGERGHFQLDVSTVVIGIVAFPLLIFLLAPPQIALWEKTLAAIFTILLSCLLGIVSFEKDTLGYCRKKEVSFLKNFKINFTTYFKLFLNRKRREFPQRIKAYCKKIKP